MNEYHEAMAELYRRGEYGHLGLFAKQIEAIAMLESGVKDEVGYGGAAAGGKSHLTCKFKISRRAAYQGSYGLTAREDKGRLQSTTMDEYKKVLDEWEYKEGSDYIYRSKDTSFNFSNGSKEQFIGLRFEPKKDPEWHKLGSWSVTDIAIDEAQEVQQDAPQILKFRRRLLKGTNTYIVQGRKVTVPWVLKPVSLYTFNPRRNWVHSRIYTPWKSNTLPEEIGFIQALPKDNPHVPDSYYQALRNADNATRQRLEFGNFDYDDDPRSLVTWEHIQDLFTNTHAERGDRYHTIDLALQGRDSCIGLNWDGFCMTFAIDEKQSKANEIHQKVLAEAQRLHIPHSKIIFDADSIGTYLGDYIPGATHYRGGAKAKNNKDFVNLRSECAWMLANLIREAKIYINCTSDQRQRIEEEISTCLKASFTHDDLKRRLMPKDEMKQVLGRSPDILDAMLQRMLPLVKKPFKPLL